MAEDVGNGFWKWGIPQAFVHALLGEGALLDTGRADVW